MKAKLRSQHPDPVVAEYARLAGQYDRRWSSYIEATARETLARISVRPGDSLLDVGCGTGVLLQRLACAYPTVHLHGVDPVPEMLAVAQRRVPSSVKLHAGWMEQLQCADGSFDTVVSSSVFHYLRQPSVALREVHRVLRPGGQFVLTDWCSDYMSCCVLDKYLRLFSPAHFKVYGRRECLHLLDRAGFPQAHIERYRINWLWGLMTVRAHKPSV